MRRHGAFGRSAGGQGSRGRGNLSRAVAPTWDCHVVRWVWEQSGLTVLRGRPLFSASCRVHPEIPIRVTQAVCASYRARARGGSCRLRPATHSRVTMLSPQCTLINQATSAVCVACGAPRPTVPAAAAAAAAPAAAAPDVSDALIAADAAFFASLPHGGAGSAGAAEVRETKGAEGGRGGRGGGEERRRNPGCAAADEETARLLAPLQKKIKALQSSQSFHAREWNPSKSPSGTPSKRPSRHGSSSCCSPSPPDPAPGHQTVGPRQPLTERWTPTRALPLPYLPLTVRVTHARRVARRSTQAGAA